MPDTSGPVNEVGNETLSVDHYHQIRVVTAIYILMAAWLIPLLLLVLLPALFIAQGTADRWHQDVAAVLRTWLYIS